MFSAVFLEIEKLCQALLIENLDGYKHISVENFCDISWLLLTSSIKHNDGMGCQVPRHYTSRRLCLAQELLGVRQYAKGIQ